MCNNELKNLPDDYQLMKIFKNINKNIKKNNTYKKDLIAIIFSISNVKNKNYKKEIFNLLSTKIKIDILHIITSETLSFDIDKKLIKYMYLDLYLFS